MRQLDWRQLRLVGYCLGGLLLFHLLIRWVTGAGYHLIFSRTASMPQGWYLVVPIKRALIPGDIVELKLDAPVLMLPRQRGWLPSEVSVIKYVAAVAGDEVVCKHGKISINRREVGTIRTHDAQGRVLPQLEICAKLKEGEYLLLGKPQTRSFDGRYFGIITAEMLQGRAIPFWIK